MAQLGVIAGGGMLIAFLCTLTILPALLVQFRPDREDEEVGLMALRRLEPIVRPLHWPILAVFTLLALVGAALTPSIPFDGDPLHTKNQHTEAVTTLNDLMEDPITNPYTVEALLPSLAAVRTVSVPLAKLPSVQDVLSLDSFLPADQPAKLAAIADAASVLAPTLTAPASPPPATATDLRRAAASLDSRLHAIAPKLTLDNPLRALTADLDRLQAAPDATWHRPTTRSFGSCRCSLPACEPHWPPSLSPWPTCPPSCGATGCCRMDAPASSYCRAPHVHDAPRCTASWPKSNRCCPRRVDRRSKSCRAPEP